MNTGVPSPGGKAAGVYGYHSSPSGEAKNDWRDKYILFVWFHGFDRDGCTFLPILFWKEKDKKKCCPVHRNLARAERRPHSIR